MSPQNLRLSVGRLIREFLFYSLQHGGADVAAETTRIACILAGRQNECDPTRLASWLCDRLSELVEEADHPIEVIEHGLAGGALIMRDLLEQASGDESRAQAYLYLFTQDWTNLFLGIPLPRQWIAKGRS